MSIIRNAWTKFKVRLNNYDPPGEGGPHGVPTMRSINRDEAANDWRSGPGGGGTGGIA